MGTPTIIPKNKKVHVILVKNIQFCISVIKFMLNSQQCTLMTETLSRHGLVQCIYVYNIYICR